MPRNILDELAEFKKIKMQNCVTICEVLMALVKGILQCTDFGALDILEKRHSAEENQNTCYS